MCLAVPGEIVEVRMVNGLRFARVRFGDVLRDVCLEYLPEAKVGDHVAVHVGVAVAVIDPEEEKAFRELFA